MKMSCTRRSARKAVFLSLGLATGLCCSRTIAAATIPPDYDTHGKVTGDPRNAREDFAKIYQAMNAFRAQHGRYPAEPIELINAIGKNPQAYGFKKGRDVTRGMMSNPDSRYSDSSVARRQPDSFIPYQMRASRFDGTALGSAKAAGTRDLLAWTSLYYHLNIEHERDAQGRITNISSHPVGFFVVLWDDGSIEQVPFDKQLYAPVGHNSWQTAFPGQAGLPAHTLTYEQFQKQAA